MLDDLVVIELASVLAGPSAGMFLAELGARVIKVENPGTGGDTTRGWRLAGEPAGGTLSGYFCAANWGKESLVLDLTRPEGREVVHDLVRCADIVIQSYKPGDDARRGVDPKTLADLKPGLIQGCITAYGREDPRPGFDAIIQAESGFTYINGERDGPPTKMPVALMDLLAAHQLKEGLLLALLKRERTGEGSVVEVSLLQSAVAALANQATNWLVGGSVPQRMGSSHPNVVPYGTLYRAADGQWIVLGVGTDGQFRALTRALEREELADDPRFAANAERVRHRDLLDAELGAAIARHATPTLRQRLTVERVPFGAVNDMPAVFAQPAAAEMVLRATGPMGERLAGVRSVAFGGTPGDVPGAPPALGADTDRVLGELLRYEAERVGRLRASGVLGP